jgi:hypothetical protein
MFGNTYLRCLRMDVSACLTSPILFLLADLSCLMELLGDVKNTNRQWYVFSLWFPHPAGNAAVVLARVLFQYRVWHSRSRFSVLIRLTPTPAAIQEKSELWNSNSLSAWPPWAYRHGVVQHHDFKRNEFSSGAHRPRPSAYIFTSSGKP